MNRIIAVSSCFMINARYNGENAISDEITAFLDFLRDNNIAIIPICPEQMGGLPTPRVASEIINGKVIGKDGTDYTDNFTKGAEEVLRILKFQKVEVAFLRQKSPSCGYGKIYDGTFTYKLIAGNGITAQLLKDNGISVYTEDDLTDLDILKRHFNIEPGR